MERLITLYFLFRDIAFKSNRTLENNVIFMIKVNEHVGNF